MAEEEKVWKEEERRQRAAEEKDERKHREKEEHQSERPYATPMCRVRTQVEAGAGSRSSH